MSPHHSDTIVAPATAPGQAAIAIIRLSGPDAFSIAQKVLRRASGNAPVDVNPRQVQFASLVTAGVNNNQRELDQVLVTFFVAPKSYTGEDLVEISCHGSPYIVEEAIAALVKLGARIGEPGEFTRRAFLHGKIDLSQAEAVIDLIHATGERSHHAALDRLHGDARSTFLELKQTVDDAVSMTEAYLNFPDDIVDEADDAKIAAALDAAVEKCRQVVSRLADRRYLFDGVRVLLVGAPNVGKSSLFNRLIGHERALVSEVAGTTRDYLEADFSADGFHFKLFDQAGWRAEGAEELERRGMEMGTQLWPTIDLFVFVQDATRPLTDDEKQLAELLPEKPRLIVRHKADLLDNREVLPNANHVAISSKDRTGFDDLKQWLVQQATALGTPYGAETLSTDRWQREALQEAASALDDARTALTGGMSLEFVSVDCRRAQDALGRLFGESTADDILNRIFQRFCIGK